MSVQWLGAILYSNQKTPPSQFLCCFGPPFWTCLSKYLPALARSWGLLQDLRDKDWPQMPYHSRSPLHSAPECTHHQLPFHWTSSTSERMLRFSGRSLKKYSCSETALVICGLAVYLWTILQHSVCMMPFSPQLIPPQTYRGHWFLLLLLSLFIQSFFLGMIWCLQCRFGLFCLGQVFQLSSLLLWCLHLFTDCSPKSPAHYCAKSKLLSGTNLACFPMNLAELVGQLFANAVSRYCLPMLQSLHSIFWSSASFFLFWYSRVSRTYAWEASVNSAASCC